MLGRAGSEEVGAVELGQGDDLWVGGGVEEEGDEFVWRKLEGGADDRGEDGVLGEEVVPVAQGGGEGGGDGGAGAG